MITWSYHIEFRKIVTMLREDASYINRTWKYEWTRKTKKETDAEIREILRNQETNRDIHIEEI